MLFLPLLLATLALATNPGGTFLCGAGKPALTVKAGGGHTLYLCAVNSKKRRGKLEVSGFKVFEAGKKKAVFASEPENDLFFASASGKELRLEELVWNGKTHVPAFAKKVSCDTSGCRIGAAECAFEKIKAGSRRALDQIRDYQHGKHKGKVPSSSVINALAALAYSGDADAAAVFQDRGSLILDGEAGERYFDHQAMIAKLKKAGCL